MKKIILGLGSIAAAIAPIATSISCLNGPDYKDSDKTINFNYAIPSTWPQHKALKDIVNEWNTKQTQKKNFMKVKIADGSTNGHSSFTELENTVNKLVSSDLRAPNLIIANQKEMNSLAAYKRILNMESNIIKSSLFFDEFMEGKNKIIGHEKSLGQGLWSLPITTTTNMSLLVNKPILAKVIALLQNHGAQVEKDLATNPNMNEIMQSLSYDYANLKIELNNNESASEYITNLWKDKKSNNKNDLINYKINDDTFKTLTSYYEFINKVQTTLGYKHDVAHTVSYLGSLFNQILFSKAKTENTDFALFKKETNKYSYPFLKTNSVAEKQFKETAQFIIDRINDNSLNTWNSSHAISKIKDGKAMMIQIPSVASKYAYGTEYGFKFDDIMLMNQISKFENLTENGSVSMAESSLMAIKNNEEEDKSTKAFVNWLLTGTMSMNTPETADDIKVTEYLSRNSGYIIPLKENMSLSAKTKINTLYKNLLKNPDGDKYSKAANLRAMINSHNSLSGGAKYKNFQGDQYTSKLIKIIENTLKKIADDKRTKNGNWTPTKFLEEIKKRKTEYFV